MSEEQTPTAEEIGVACLWYRHDYGLMSDDEKRTLRFEALEWFLAWQKTGIVKVERKQ